MSDEVAEAVVVVAGVCLAGVVTAGSGVRGVGRMRGVSGVCGSCRSDGGKSEGEETDDGVKELHLSCWWFAEPESAEVKSRRESGERALRRSCWT